MADTEELPFAEYTGKSLVATIDARFKLCAFDQLAHDERWVVWCEATRPGSQREPVCPVSGIALAVPPPTDGLLTRLLGPGWWWSLDGRMHDIETAPPESDPLLTAAVGLPRGALREAFVAAVIEARPFVLFDAAELLFQAVETGAVALTGLDGFDRHPISPDVFRTRRWRLRRDGCLLAPRADGSNSTLGDVRIEAVPAATAPVAPAGAQRRGYRGADLPLVHEMKAIVDREKCSVFRAAAVVADRAKGSNQGQSREKRLTGLFYQTFPQYRDLSAG